MNRKRRGRLMAFLYCCLMFFTAACLSCSGFVVVRIERQHTIPLDTIILRTSTRSNEVNHTRRRTTIQGRSTSNHRIRQQKPPMLMSRAYQEVLERLDFCRTPDNVEEWIQECIQQEAEWNLSPREETEFVRDLGKRQAYSSILLFVQKITKKPTVYLYTAAMTCLGGSSSEWRNKAVELFSELPTYNLQPTSYTLTALLRSLDASEVQRWMKRIVQDYPQCLTVQVYNTAIAACLNNNKKDATDDPSVAWQTALKLFLDMKRQSIVPTADTFSALLRVCAKARQLRVALSLLEEALQTKKPDEDLSRVFSSALFACSQAGDTGEALRVLQIMQEYNQTSINTYHVSEFLKCLAKQGQDELALHILLDGMLPNATIVIEYGGLSTELPPIPADLVGINIVLDACAKAGNYPSARMLLDRLKTGDILDFTTKEPLAPDSISYNTVLAACNDPVAAQTLIKEMRDSRRYRYGSTPPTSVSYTHAITACRKADPPDVQTALALLKMADDDGNEPSVFMYSAAIWTAERAGGDYETAISLLKEMRSVGCAPNVVSYNGVISALAVHGCAKEAVRIWNEMKDDNIQPNKVTFQRLASSIRDSNETVADKIELLESVFERMNSDELQTTIGGPLMETLIRLYGSVSRFGDAVRVFVMIEGPVDSQCLRAVLYACSAATPPRWEEAISILHTSDIVEGSTGPARVDPKALSCTILACCKADEWEEALNLAELYAEPMRSDNKTTAMSRPAFNALIAACGRAGQPSLALRILNDMKEVFGVTPDELTYRKTIIACNQAEHDKRRRLEQNKDQYPNEDDDLDGFEWWECALSLLRRMKEEGLTPDPQTYSSVISACEAAGQWQRALGVLQSMMNLEGQASRKNGQLNLYCFNAAISACEKGGAWVEATELYYRMLDVGGVVSPNFVTLNSLLVALDKAGQKELAQSTYEDGVSNHIISPWKITKAADGSPLRALDLHKCSGAMAKTVIRSVMESLLDGETPEHDVTRDLIIIVGKGKGSQKEPVLLSTALKILKQDYGITGVLDPKNAGRLIVDSATLQEFTFRKRWR